MEIPKKSMGKSYLSLPHPLKGLWWDTKRLFIYLFIYYPIEDKHELWGTRYGYVPIHFN
jgi:hypothetical protein